MATRSIELFSQEFASDWESACRGDAELRHLSAHASVRFSVQADAASLTMAIVDGALESVRPGNTAAEFSLRAPTEVWQRFMQAVPPAPYHHVFAMKMRVPEFSVAGDEQKLLQHAALVRRSLELARWIANGRSRSALRPDAPTASRAPGSVEPIVGRYAAIEIEGRSHRVYYEQSGTGPDLLFLHTAGSDTRQFHHLMNDAGLMRDWRMSAFDLPWHGKSLPPVGGVPGEWHNSVRDWILFRYHDYTWPNFNIADSLMVCGALVLLWQGMRNPAPENPSDQPAE